MSEVTIITTDFSAFDDGYFNKIKEVITENKNANRIRLAILAHRNNLKLPDAIIYKTELVYKIEYLIDLESLRQKYQDIDMLAAYIVYAVYNEYKTHLVIH